jgi:hypothetical protein
MSLVPMKPRSASSLPVTQLQNLPRLPKPQHVALPSSRQRTLLPADKSRVVCLLSCDRIPSAPARPPLHPLRIPRVPRLQGAPHDVQPLGATRFALTR